MLRGTKVAGVFGGFDPVRHSTKKYIIHTGGPKIILGSSARWTDFVKTRQPCWYLIREDQSIVYIYICMLFTTIQDQERVDMVDLLNFAFSSDHLALEFVAVIFVQFKKIKDRLHTNCVNKTT